MADQQQSNGNGKQGLDLSKKLPAPEQVNRQMVVVGVAVFGLFVVALIGFGFLGGDGEEAGQHQQEGPVAENLHPPEFETQEPQPQASDAWRVSSNGATSAAVEAARRAQKRARQRKSQQPPPSVQTPGRSGQHTPTSSGEPSTGSPSPREQAFEQALQAPIMAVGGGGAQDLQQRSGNRQSASRLTNGQQRRQRPPGRAAPPGPGPMEPMKLPEASRERHRDLYEALTQGQGAAGRPQAPPRGTARQRPGASPYGPSAPGTGASGSPPIRAPRGGGMGSLRTSGRASSGASSGSGGGGASMPGRSSFQDRATDKAARGVYIASQVNEPISEYEIDAGTVVPAVLETAINSDLPGEIIARVTRPVYDRTQRHLLIPAGTKLLGSYSSRVQVGQSRALLAWTRMIFPNGNSVALPGLSGKDLEGATGIEDKVNNHYGRMIATAGAVALVGAGVQLAVPDGGGSSFGAASQSPQQVISRQIALELSRLATRMLQRQMEIEPTLKVRKGYRFYVYFNRDLAFEGPYSGEDPQQRFRRFDGDARARAPRRVYTEPASDSTYRRHVVPLSPTPDQ